MFLPDQLAAPHEEDLDARLALRFCDRDQVHVDTRTPNDLLIFGHAAHRDDAIANARRGFEVHAFRGRVHLALQTIQQTILLTLEKQDHFVDQGVVFVFGLEPDAGRETALDVVLQAGPFALPVDRLAARAQRKGNPHDIDQFADAVRVGVRPEVACPVVAHHAREHHARKGFVRDLEIRIALVVAQPDVERRLVAFDEVRFENERFDLVVDHDPTHVDDALDHALRAQRVGHAILKVGTHAVTQRHRFADVEYALAGAEHQVDAGSVRKLSQRRLERALPGHGREATSPRRRALATRCQTKAAIATRTRAIAAVETRCSAGMIS